MSLGQRLKPLAKFDDLSRLIKKNDLKSFFHIKTMSIMNITFYTLNLNNTNVFNNYHI
jgi:hypothetical protein